MSKLAWARTCFDMLSRVIGIPATLLVQPAQAAKKRASKNGKPCNIAGVDASL